MNFLSCLFICFNFLSIVLISTALDTITIDQQLKDGDTIISPGGVYELGFFRPGNSTNRYIGIWYKKISTGTVVWVANRNSPLNDTSGVLMFKPEGILVLINSTNAIIWSSNSSKILKNPIARLLDSGNFIVRDDNNNDPENFAWQSFDYPGDTLLPGMKLGRNFVTGLDWYISSWKSIDDPGTGEYVDRFDIQGYPQLFVWKSSSISFSSGPWNGLAFSGSPKLQPNTYFTFGFVLNQDEVYYKYDIKNGSLATRLVLTPGGLVNHYTWIDRTESWFLYLTAQFDNCDRFALCGPYARCVINNSPPCECLRGFEPKYPQQWDAAGWSSGCVRRSPLACQQDGFRTFTGIKVPDTRNSWYNESIGLEECKTLCLADCNCTAYSNLDVRNGGSGCLLWFGDLIDMRELSANQQELFVRVAASEVDQDKKRKRKRSRLIAIISAVIATGVLGLLAWYAFHRRRKRTGREVGTDDMELPLFDLVTIATATKNFSSANVIGEGGFGPVYKGKLPNGPEIAVKRLSEYSGQGLQELKNEVILISKLQHRNLVKLLGCCLEGEERMLIYEFMPNNSLDYFIFVTYITCCSYPPKITTAPVSDPQKMYVLFLEESIWAHDIFGGFEPIYGITLDSSRKGSLVWRNRYKIAMGISRGLLYLHQDSRLRIIHRDLKTSNILLDTDLNPRISDFGLAKLFVGDQMEGKTKRVIGTYGYMAPEYAVDGKFSVKSDVFSLGVLLLEIVSGRKNRKFHHLNHHHNLLGHAWLLWNEGKDLELLDECLKESYIESQVMRCIQVSLLCVQKFPEERPTMESVVFWLSNEDVELPQPKQPGFFIERYSTESNESTDDRCITDNTMSLTILEAR